MPHVPISIAFLKCIFKICSIFDVLRLSKSSHGFTFQQLNARSHKARVDMSFRQHQSIDVMPYHLRLPDLNAIYHIFDELNIRVHVQRDTKYSDNPFKSGLSRY